MLEYLSVFSGKLRTFDNFNWAIISNKMNTYEFSLCSCPIVNPKDEIRKNTYHYSLTNNLLSYK